MTLSGLGLVLQDKVDHIEPEEILETIETKEERVFELINEMRKILQNGKLNGTI